MNNSLNRILISLVVRFLEILLLKTYYCADEFWQGPEIAHKLVYGYGYESWEWTDKNPIRSYFHPLVYAVGYYMLKLFNINNLAIVQLTPKLIQLPFLVLYDECIYLLTYRIFGHYPALFAYICNLSNYFLAYGLIRTNSNCFETFFLVYSLCVWNFESPNSRGKERVLGILLSGLTVLFRPTPVIYLILIYSYHFYITNTKLEFIFFNLLPITVLLFLLQIISDSLFYGHFTVTMFNFFIFNLYSNNSSLYGVLPFYWYFAVALPVMCGIYILLLPLILKYCNNLCIFNIAIISLLLNSLFDHKEYRFIYVAISLITIYFGDVIYHLWIKYGNKIINCLLIITVIIHTIVFVFLARIHQRGSLDVIEYLSYEVKDKPNDIKVYILDTCHMTPYYSYIHKNITMSFPDCSPANRKRVGGSDTDRLIKNPLEFVYQAFDDGDNNRNLPDYIVTTESKMKGIESWLDEKGFKKIYPISKVAIIEYDPDVKFYIFKR